MGVDREKLISYIQPYITKTVKGSFHELGCGSGANLSQIKETFPKMTRVSGNDINGHEDGNLGIVIRDTFDLLAETEDNCYDYILTCAHLVHLTDEKDDMLIEHIPRITGKYLFLYEPNHATTTDGKKSRGNKWYRDYSTFFGKKKVKLIKEIKGKLHTVSYSLYIFKIV